jgi:hypothetical protein
VKLEIGLRAEHHTSGCPRRDHDALTFDADEVQLVNEIAPTRPLMAKRSEYFEHQGGEIPELREEIRQALDHGVHLCLTSKVMHGDGASDKPNKYAATRLRDGGDLFGMAGDR